MENITNLVTVFNKIIHNHSKQPRETSYNGHTREFQKRTG